MTAATLTCLVYGILVLGGGILGYRTAGSRPSLIAGTLSGAAMLVAALLLMRGVHAALWLALAVAALLLLFFAMRWLKGRKFMPAGLMALASLVALALLIWSGWATPPGR